MVSPAHPAHPARAIAIMAIAGVVVSALFADAMLSAAYDLPPSPLGDRLIAGAEWWQEMMARLGVVQVIDHLTSLVHHLHAVPVSGADG